MVARHLCVAVLASLASCNVFESSDVYLLEVRPASVHSPQAGWVRLSGSERIEWHRVYAPSSGHTATGRFRFHGDSLRVSWADDYWYTLGVRTGRTLDVWYSGVADEPHREFYVKQ